MRILLALLAIDFVAPLDLNKPPGIFTWLHLQLLKVDPERCYAALDRAQVNYKRFADPIKNGCGFDNGAMLLGSEINHGGHVLMTCHGLAGLLLWERAVVAPAAERYFGGSKLVRVHNMGTYSCRNIEHKKDKRRSEHATANAIDVGGFGFSNGAQISYRKGLEGHRRQGRFPARGARRRLQDFQRGAIAGLQSEPQQPFSHGYELRAVLPLRLSRVTMTGVPKWTRW